MSEYSPSEGSFAASVASFQDMLPTSNDSCFMLDAQLEVREQPSDSVYPPTLARPRASLDNLPCEVDNFPWNRSEESSSPPTEGRTPYVSYDPFRSEDGGTSTVPPLVCPDDYARWVDDQFKQGSVRAETIDLDLYLRATTTQEALSAASVSDQDSHSESESSDDSVSSEGLTPFPSGRGTPSCSAQPDADFLHDEGLGPLEERRSVCMGAFAQDLNATAPILLAKQLKPMPIERRPMVFTAITAVLNAAVRGATRRGTTRRSRSCDDEEEQSSSNTAANERVPLQGSMSWALRRRRDA